MSSAALHKWRGHRLRHLDDLMHTHRLVSGSASESRRRMAAVNAALVLRLAAEFQGFARELHEEASVVFAAWIASGNQLAQEVTRDALIRGRELDRGNAHPGAIGNDFARLGLQVWARMIARDRRTRQLNQSLELLNTARNAIAHADDGKLATLRTGGCRIVLGTFRNWRRDLDDLAGKLDLEVGAGLGQVFARRSPW
jgi:hypothetical protein